jgi:6-pyruvoyl-tetrahydropterin synthase-like protein
MILSKRVVYGLLLSLSAANILFRYPLDVGHELGADTTFVHTLATGVTQTGHAGWVIHPLSYFGLYALSYPSAIPFTLGSTSLTTGLPMEGAMLFFGWIVSIAGAWGAYLASRSIRRDDLFALTVAVLFSLSPFYVKDTFWVGSSRGFVVGLVPVLVLLLVKHLRTMRIRYFVLAIVLIVLLTAIHRMGVLAFFVLVAYLFAIPFHRVTQRLRFSLARYERLSRYAMFLSGVTGFVSMFYVQFAYPGLGGADVVEQYGQGVLQGSSFPLVLANMGFSLAGKIGPLIPFAVVGLVAYTWRRPKEVVDKFVLTAVLLFLPLLPLRDYIAEFLFLFFVLVMVIGLFSIRRLRPNRQKLAASLIVVLLAGSVATSWVMKDYWRGRYPTDAAIPDNTYSTGVYVKHTTFGTLLANEGLLGGHLAAVSGRAVLPLGGPSLHWTSPQQLLWGFVNPAGVGVRALEIMTISFNTDSIFVPVNVRNSEVDWEVVLFYTAPEVANRNLQTYDVHYVIVDKRIPFEFESYGYDRPSGLLVLLDDTSYKVYDSTRQSIWYV